MNEVYEVMKKYGKFMAGLDYPVGNARLVQMTSEGVFSTVDGCDLSDLKEEDIIRLPGDTMPVPCGDMKALVYSQTPYCMEWIRRGRSFDAALDDMAQIFGPNALVVDFWPENPCRDKDIKKALKDNVGFLAVTQKGENGENTGQTLTFGRSLYEAVVAMTVIEKSAEVSVLAEKIGGPHPIARWEAKLMRLIYKKKYSKAEEAVKTREVG